MIVMGRKEEILRYAQEMLGGEPEYLWAATPDCAVLRHPGNGKWYAIFMEVPKNRLGLPGGEPVSILNVKCDPILMGAMLTNPGMLPGYHMNKTHWLTILLDGTVPEETVVTLLNMSYDLTNVRKGAGKKRSRDGDGGTIAGSSGKG